MNAKTFDELRNTRDRVEWIASSLPVPFALPDVYWRLHKYGKPATISTIATQLRKLAQIGALVEVEPYTYVTAASSTASSPAPSTAT